MTGRPPPPARPLRPAAPAGLPRLPRWAACRINRRMLYEAESGRASRPGVLDRHRRECLACQAAAVQQRRLLREMRSLRSRLEPAPYDMAAVFYHPVAVSQEEQEAARAPFAVRSARRAAVASAASLAALGAVVAAGRWIRSHAG